MKTNTNTTTKMRSNQFYFGLLIVIVSTLFNNVASAQTKKCEAELKIENNVSSKNATVLGTSFKMSLTGLSDRATKYKISVRDSKRNNINYKVKFFVLNKKDVMDYDYKKSSDSDVEITLSRGETLHFIVELLAPKNIKIGDAIISEVVVTSEECSDFFISKELQINITKGITTKQH